MVVWGLLGAVDAATTATWVVISLIYATPAALVFALVGAAAGSVTSLLWGQRHRWGKNRSQAAASIVTGVLVGSCAGLAIALLMSSAPTGVVVGLVAAIVASVTAFVTLRKLDRRTAGPS
jgi:cobalamin synthase